MSHIKVFRLWLTIMWQHHRVSQDAIIAGVPLQGRMVYFTFGNNRVVIVRNAAHAKSWIKFHVATEITLLHTQSSTH